MKIEQAAHLALTLTGLLLLTLLLLGLSLQLGRRPSAPRPRLARWPHHALFLLVCVGTLVSGVLTCRAGGHWWALLPALALLFGMTRTRPGRADHWQRALACAVAYVAGAFWAW